MPWKDVPRRESLESPAAFLFPPPDPTPQSSVPASPECGALLSQFIDVQLKAIKLCFGCRNAPEFDDLLRLARDQLQVGSKLVEFYGGRSAGGRSPSDAANCNDSLMLPETSSTQHMQFTPVKLPLHSKHLVTPSKPVPSYPAEHLPYQKNSLPELPVPPQKGDRPLDPFGDLPANHFDLRTPIHSPPLRANLNESIPALWAFHDTVALAPRLSVSPTPGVQPPCPTNSDAENTPEVSPEMRRVVPLTCFIQESFFDLRSFANSMAENIDDELSGI